MSKPSKSPSEYSLHVAVADFFRAALPDEILWTHLPMGEVRTARTGGKLKKMGTQPGWPDFILLIPVGMTCDVLFIELKRPGGSLSKTQKEFRERAEAITDYYLVAEADPVGIVQTILKAHGVKLKAEV